MYSADDPELLPLKEKAVGTTSGNDFEVEPLYLLTEEPGFSRVKEALLITRFKSLNELKKIVEIDYLDANPLR